MTFGLTKPSVSLKIGALFIKKNLPPFIAGMATMALAGSLCASALSATGQLTVTVDPVNIQVNGQTFQPKDAQGNSVPVFAYNGTTYAPLRALAEAYGLEVGYDAEAKMATVNQPSSGPVINEKDPTTISQYVKVNAIQIGDKTYQLPEYSINGVNVDENGQIYIREHLMDELRFAILVIEGKYEVVDGDNPKADGRIKITERCGLEESKETVYLSASEQAEDYRVSYNGNVLVSPASPNYVDGKDNLGVRKIHAYGSVTPIGWWFNLNDLLDYFGVNGTLAIDIDKNLLIIE